jgi:hypothetical protein
MTETIAGLALDAKTAASLAHILKDFGPPTETDDGFTGVKVNNEIPVVELVRPILEHCGFRMRSHSDKTAWTADGTFRGIDIDIAATLYGPRVRVTSSFNGDVQALVIDAAETLAKATVLVERTVIGRHVRDRADAGHVVLLNVSKRLYGGYDLFRWHGRALLDGHGDPEVRESALASALTAAGAGSPGPWFIPANIGFYVTAMTTAWFSWLEHVLVLSMPFTNWDPSVITVQQAIALKWTDKMEDDHRAR